MSKWVLLAAFFSMACYGNQTSMDFETFKKDAKSLNAQPKDAMKAFNPQALFEHYSEHPEQEGYYQGIQNEQTNLSSQANAAIKHDPGAQTVIENFGKNKFELDQSNALLAQSQLIQDESYAITHGQSNERVQCDNQALKCTLKTHEEQCFSSRLLPNQRCAQHLRPVVDSNEVIERADFSFVVADECTLQKNKGCFQIASECARFENNHCTLYKQTYNCQENVCQAPVECVKDLFCADGECTEHVQTQNSDYGQSVSALAVVGEVGHEWSQQPGVSLFGGKAMQCKVWKADLIDCCHDKGWGKDIHLLHCRNEDRALGQAKLNYVAHYLGKFCRTNVLEKCLEYKHSYCVFPTKMARIVQEARLNQVNPQGLGNAEHPTCAGISIAELQTMDLGRVDFVTPIYPFGHGTPNPEAGIAGDLKIKEQDPQKSIDEIVLRMQKKAGEW